MGLRSRRWTSRQVNRLCLCASVALTAERLLPDSGPLLVPLSERLAQAKQSTVDWLSQNGFSSKDELRKRPSEFDGVIRSITDKRDEVAKKLPELTNAVKGLWKRNFTEDPHKHSSHAWLIDDLMMEKDAPRTKQKASRQAATRGPVMQKIQQDPLEPDVAVCVACRAAENLILCIFVAICAYEWHFRTRPAQHHVLDPEVLKLTAQKLQRQGEDWDDSEMDTSFFGSSPERSNSAPVVWREQSEGRAPAALADHSIRLNSAVKAVLEVDGPRKWDSSAITAFAQLRRAALHAAGSPDAFEREVKNAPAVLGFLSTFVDRYPIRVKQACEVLSLLAQHPGWAAALPSSELTTRGRAHAELHAVARRAARQQSQRGGVDASSRQVSSDSQTMVVSMATPKAAPGAGALRAGSHQSTARARGSTSRSPSRGADGHYRLASSGDCTPYGGEGQEGDFFIGEPIAEFERGISTPSDVEVRSCRRAEQESDKARVVPSIAMMVLLHVVYPSYPMSPEVGLGRIATFVGLLWCLGPAQCTELVKLERMRVHRLIILAFLCAVVNVCIWSFTDTLSYLIFPRASRPPYQVPRYLGEILQYLTSRWPPEGADFVAWVTWSVVGASSVASAVWEEFLFRGVYLSGLRNHMPFWAANAAAALVFALEREPADVNADGTVIVQLGPMVPLMAGALWSGYVYHRCGNLGVNMLSHSLVNGGLVWFYMFVSSRHA